MWEEGSGVGGVKGAKISLKVGGWVAVWECPIMVYFGARVDPNINPNVVMGRSKRRSVILLVCLYIYIAATNVIKPVCL